MKYIGMKIYYDRDTGNVIQVIGEAFGEVIETTTEQDVYDYTSLSERNRESFDVVQFEYGQYREEFMKSTSFRVDIETKELVFDYTQVEKDGVFYQPTLEEIQTQTLLNTEYLVVMSELNSL